MVSFVVQNCCSGSLTVIQVIVSQISSLDVGHGPESQPASETCLKNPGLYTTMKLAITSNLL